MTMPMDKNDKKKALDLMIVLGGPKGGKGKMEDEGEDYSEKGGLEKMLKMHPLSEMSADDLEELSEAVSSELSSRESDEEEDDEDY
jgi:hypothetical protein